MLPSWAFGRFLGSKELFSFDEFVIVLLGSQ